MAMEKNFRSALNGFHRADVVNYMEECSINQEKALRQLRDENEKLRESLDKLRAEKQALCDAICVDAPEPEPESAPDIPEVPAPALPREPSELELAAYRRAESMERSARQRARRLCRQVNEIVESASSQMCQSQTDVQTLMQDLSINLRRLTDTFAELKLTFDGTTDALEAIDPLDASEYGV